MAACVLGCNRGVNPIKKLSFIKIVTLLLCLSMISCSGKRPPNLGVIDSKLSSCPQSPNCVSSDSEDDSHYIAPFQLDTFNSEAWEIAKESVLKLPRTQIIHVTADYLHAECRSALLGFVDDLELHHRSDERIIAIRSASRLGTYDFGVNRKRIENLQTMLIDRGIISK